MAERLWQRLHIAMTSLPSRGDALSVAFEIAWLIPVLLLLCSLGGLLDWQPRFDPGIAKLAAVAIIAPALGEELLFRAALLPEPDERPLPLGPLLISVALFVLWHPLQAPLFGPHWGEVVLNPWFLAAVAAFGLASARIYWKTGSIWPSVLLHWLIVVGWKALLGGPSPWVSG